MYEWGRAFVQGVRAYEGTNPKFVNRNYELTSWQMIFSAPRDPNGRIRFDTVKKQFSEVGIWVGSGDLDEQVTNKMGVNVGLGGLAGDPKRDLGDARASAGAGRPGGSVGPLGIH